MDNTKFRIGKTYISLTNPQNAINRVTQAAKKGEGGYICVSNMRMVLYAGETPEYNDLMKGSFMNWPDGRPLSWCGRMWGLKDVRCTSGPATFKKMMSSNNKDLKHFLFGDTQDVLDAIVSRYKDTANIVGVYSPPFAPLEEFDLDAMEKMIRESGANVVWTAMTAPKQDYFDKLMAQRMQDIVFIGVGRAFRISIDIIKEAPDWAAKMGVGGMFIGRSKFHVRLWHYISRTFILAWYFIEIVCKRIVGKKYYE